MDDVVGHRCGLLSGVGPVLGACQTTAAWVVPVGDVADCEDGARTHGAAVLVAYDSVLDGEARGRHPFVVGDGADTDHHIVGGQYLPVGEIHLERAALSMY